MIPPYFMVFDVESWGLHGPALALGFVVIDTATGLVVDAGVMAVDGLPDFVSQDDVDWITEHVLPAIQGTSRFARRSQLFSWFSAAWNRWHARGALLAADVPWPVEARFLLMAHEYERVPPIYPLIDIASVIVGIGGDPLAFAVRRAGEIPAHNPLMDARHSARLLMEALGIHA